jgi:hypothetical protein
VPIGFRLTSTSRQSCVLDIQTTAQEELVDHYIPPPVWIAVVPELRIGPITTANGHRELPKTSVLGQALAAGALLRFDSKGPWYTYIPAVDATSSAHIARLTPSDPWPNTVHTIRARLRPQPTTESATIGSGLCVDMVWCGHGSPVSYRTGATRFCTLSNDTIVPDGSVDVCFDPSGRLQSVWRTTADGPRAPVKPVGVLILLVGSPDRAGQAYDARVSPESRLTDVGANWQYPDSYWIAIDPSTGAVRTAPTIPYASDVVASQALVRTRSENVQQ